MTKQIKAEESTLADNVTRSEIIFHEHEYTTSTSAFSKIWSEQNKVRMSLKCFESLGFF